MSAETKRHLGALGVALAVGLVGWLCLAPVAVTPVAWEAPPNPGYVGAHAPNERLSALEVLPLGPYHGPEDLAVGPDGALYVAVAEGWILRLPKGADGFERWAPTGGRPLGIEFDPAGGLWVADALRGLLHITTNRELRVVATEAGGVPIGFADDVDITPDGRVWFTDATTKFLPSEHGGTYPASKLDLFEHGGHGRLLVHDPRDGSTTVALAGLQFANGLAATPDGSALLLCETGSYRVLRVDLSTDGPPLAAPILEALPGFCDNVQRDAEGRFWVGLVSPRRAIVDVLAPYPGLRAAIQRLPTALHPDARRHGHVIAIDRGGRVLADLQDPSGRYALTTGALTHDGWLYVSSLTEPGLGRLRIDEALGR